MRAAHKAAILTLAKGMAQTGPVLHPMPRLCLAVDGEAGWRRGLALST
jgi:hypothetical protein